ncbi:glycine betaine ABC transporter substrate-binding protein [Devosia nitrariae]|uniref:ABC transporter substrate-binding protein n=1 Tax=Devosia nitrariae TaxID=2071872 RepID=A0ABQ5W2E9_9HYPH|nr:glycine betaine ABC transporter substrate-binding protein [Devosia nitrariae]GLQ54234.1 ABC transporter substrate-binding protein [Devosia nitrariae]
MAPVLTVLCATLSPVAAQQGFTVLDEAQDALTVPQGEAAPCGGRPLAIARMQWPSAAVLAEIHARLLARHFDCEVQVVPGDMAGSGSAMAATGQPAVAPELWIARIADVWNQAVETQTVRAAANTYDMQVFEGWYIPGYLAEQHPDLTGTAALATGPAFDATQGGRARFISCPPDWGCAIINRNLVAALGLEDRFELVEPANRFEMDRLIAEAVSRREAFVAYYWAPNAVIDQFGFKRLDLGAYDAEAMQCLADAECAAPAVSDFPAETVVVALAEWVFDEAPRVAGYFQRASLPLAEMDKLLAEIGTSGATPEAVAERFVAEKADIWSAWVGAESQEGQASD